MKDHHNHHHNKENILECLQVNRNFPKYVLATKENILSFLLFYFNELYSCTNIETEISQRNQEFLKHFVKISLLEEAS